MNGEGERDGGPFARAEKGECGIGGRVGSHFTPGGRLCHLGAHCSRCLILLQFFGNTLRDEHALIQCC